MTSVLRNDDRLHELLADRSLFCVDDADLAELEALLRDPEIARLAEEYELAAASLDPALAETDSPALPESISRAVRSSAPESRRAHADSVAPAPPVVLGRIGFVPWLVTAAAVLIAAVAILRPWSDAEFDPAVARLALLEEPGTTEIVWQPQGDASVNRWVGGDVVWNGVRQTGYMRFTGLAPNDPTIEQYQLWIFDAQRSEATPVDGGVFDVSTAGEVVVPIDAKLLVHNAAAFAVTVERPGGVVVSDRTRLALLAATPSGEG